MSSLAPQAKKTIRSALLPASDPQFAACGEDVTQLLALASPEALRLAQRVAYASLLQRPFSEAPRHWLLAFAQCAVLLALETDATRAMYELDRALIIAGPNSFFSETIRSAMKQIQAKLPLLDPIPFTPQRPPARLKICSIPKFHPSTYTARLPNHPFIHQSSWPAMSKWSNPNYLAEIGSGRVVPVEIGKDYRGTDWSQALVPFEDFLSRAFGARNLPIRSALPTLIDEKTAIEEGGSDEGGDDFPEGPEYLAQFDLISHLPNLRKDIQLPDYVFTCADDDVPEAKLNVWMGRGDIGSPAHTDPYRNSYTQVCGQKRIMLAPPESGKYFGSADGLMENSACIDVDVWRELPAGLREEFGGRIYQHTLSPGETIVFPKGWYHAMKSLDGEWNASVSCWF